MPNINGVSGTVLLAAATLNVVEWSATYEGDILDTTHVGGSGWQTNIGGIKKVSGSVKANWDTAATPTGAAVACIPSTSGTITLNVGNSGASLSGTGRIANLQVENAAKGVINYSFTFESTGAWTFPT